MSNRPLTLGTRMKEYETVSRNFLTRRVPAVIRVDGKAFHSFTQGMEKTFDRILMNVMQETMRRLCENIQGCVLGYTQSDEISLVLTDYTTIQTDACFGYNIQKMSSISAAMATLFFNDALEHVVEGMPEEYPRKALYQMRCHQALFDARAFSLPKEEVCSCLIWRQQDATRNSIEAVGQANFSHRRLQGVDCDTLQELLFQEKGINWNDFPTDCKRGSACFRKEQHLTIEDPQNPGTQIAVTRSPWVIDREIPIFTRDRDYVERWL